MDSIVYSIHVLYTVHVLSSIRVAIENYCNSDPPTTSNVYLQNVSALIVQQMCLYNSSQYGVFPGASALTGCWNASFSATEWMAWTRRVDGVLVYFCLDGFYAPDGLLPTTQCTTNSVLNGLWTNVSSNCTGMCT